MTRAEPVVEYLDDSWRWIIRDRNGPPPLIHYIDGTAALDSTSIWRACMDETTARQQLRIFQMAAAAGADSLKLCDVLRALPYPDGFDEEPGVDEWDDLEPN